MLSAPAPVVELSRQQRSQGPHLARVEKLDDHWTQDVLDGQPFRQGKLASHQDPVAVQLDVQLSATRRRPPRYECLKILDYRREITAKWLRVRGHPWRASTPIGYGCDMGIARGSKVTHPIRRSAAVNRYKNMWVATIHGEVVAAGESPSEIAAMLDSLGSRAEKAVVQRSVAPTSAATVGLG